MARKNKDDNGHVYVEKKPFYKRVWFWLVVVVLVVIVAAGMGGSGSSDSSDKSASSSSSSATPLDKVYKVGQTASYKGYKIKVNSVSYSSGNEYEQPDSGKQYVIVNVTITNNTDESQDYNPYDFKLNADGNNTDLDEIYTDVDNTLNAGSLDKGASVTGNMVGQASTSVSKLQLQYQTSVWNDKTVKFDLKSNH